VRGFRANYDEFQTRNTEVIEISCDQVAVQKAWAESLGEYKGECGVPFPIASDFWPHGEVSKAYDVFNESRGISKRSVFIVDGEGMIRWSNVYTDSIPAAIELLYDIDRL